jgi:hypothetical protein
LFALLMFQLIRKLLRVGSTENDEHMRNQVTARLQRALPGRLMQRFEHTRARWRRTCSADVQLDCNIPTRRHCGHCAACRWDPAENRCATDPRAARRGTARPGTASAVNDPLMPNGCNGKQTSGKASPNRRLRAGLER